MGTGGMPFLTAAQVAVVYAALIQRVNPIIAWRIFEAVASQ